MRLWWVVMLAGLSMAPNVAAAQVEVDEFSPQLDNQLLSLPDVTLDTGWIPQNSAVQLRLFVHADDDVLVDMPGAAHYDWDAAALDFVGDPDVGLFAFDIGVQIEAEVRFDVAGIQWQSDILGPFDYAVINDTTFTPYLMAGSPDAPAVIDDTAGPVTVASVPIVPDVIVASGGLDIDLTTDVMASLFGERIELITDTPLMTSYDAHGTPIAVEPPPVGPLKGEGTLVCRLQTDPTVVIQPRLRMSILGQDFDIGGIDIPIALPPLDNELAFAPLPIAFERPETPGGDDGGGTGSADDGGAGDDGNGNAGDDAGTGDGDGGGAVQSGDGCGCRSGAPISGGSGWLGLWLLGLLRRRRQF